MVLILFVIALYFLPTLQAASRHHHNAAAIFVINLFLGWTLIGWVVALAMAARSVPPPPDWSGREIWPPRSD